MTEVCGAQMPNGARLPLMFVCQRSPDHTGYHKHITPVIGPAGGLLLRQWPEPKYEETA